MNFRLAVFGIALAWLTSLASPNWADDLSVLFLGDNGGHQPRQRFDQLQPVLASRGIQLTYTDQVSDLNKDKLSQYDALLVYANIDRVDPQYASALVDYVAGGGGFVPLHCASFCFRNSPEVVALMGAQFQRHGGEVFGVENVQSDHPIMQGYEGFESWDETYIHSKHNEQDRVVLEVRRHGGHFWDHKFAVVDHR